MHPMSQLRWLAAGLALMASFAVTRPALAGPDVAVVDMTRLMNEHPESRELDKRLKRAQEDAQAQATEQEERLRALSLEIQRLPAEDPERLAKQKQYEMQRMTAEFGFKWAQQQALRAYATSLEGLYASVVTQVDRYARENGIKVVLQRRMDEPKATSPDDFFLRQRLRVVVWHDAATDITDEVLALLKAAGGSPDVGSPPTPPAGG
jgi:Skp family chaperone for outer membrane proteins